MRKPRAPSFAVETVLRLVEPKTTHAVPRPGALTATSSSPSALTSPTPATSPPIPAPVMTQPRVPRLVASKLVAVCDPSTTYTRLPPGAPARTSAMPSPFTSPAAETAAPSPSAGAPVMRTSARVLRSTLVPAAGTRAAAGEAATRLAPSASTSARDERRMAAMLAGVAAAHARPPGPEAGAEAAEHAVLLPAAGRCGDGRAHERDPVVEGQRSGDEPRERAGHRRLDARALERPGEQRDRLERLDRLPDPGGDLRRRDALAEQLACAAVPRLGGERRRHEVPRARQADERLGPPAERLGQPPHLAEDVARRGAGRVQALRLGGAPRQGGRVLRRARQLDAHRAGGLLAGHAGGDEEGGGRLGQRLVGRGGDEGRAFGDHLPRVGGTADDRDPVAGVMRSEERRGRCAVGRHEALGERHDRRTR